MSSPWIRDDDVLGGKELRLKWKAVAIIRDRMAEQGWSAADVANMAELPRSEIEDVLRSEVRERSLYDLLCLLTCLGLSVGIDVFEVPVACGGIEFSYGHDDDD